MPHAVSLRETEQVPGRGLAVGGGTRDLPVALVDPLVGRLTAAQDGDVLVREDGRGEADDVRRGGWDAVHDPRLPAAHREDERQGADAQAELLHQQLLPVEVDTAEIRGPLAEIHGKFQSSYEQKVGGGEAAPAARAQLRPTPARGVRSSRTHNAARSG